MPVEVWGGVVGSVARAVVAPSGSFGLSDFLGSSEVGLMVLIFGLSVHMLSVLFRCLIELTGISSIVFELQVFLIRALRYIFSDNLGR
jgi:hypothetical protein